MSGFGGTLSQASSDCIIHEFMTASQPVLNEQILRLGEDMLKWSGSDVRTWPEVFLMSKALCALF